MHVYGEIKATLTSGAIIAGQLAGAETISAKLTVPEYVYPAEYGGPYTVTPAESEQTLRTGSFYLTEDITVEPIPNNYGLITWDGSTITVS